MRRPTESLITKKLLVKSHVHDQKHAAGDIKPADARQRASRVDSTIDAIVGV